MRLEDVNEALKQILWDDENHRCSRDDRFYSFLDAIETLQRRVQAALAVERQEAGIRTVRP